LLRRDSSDQSQERIPNFKAFKKNAIHQSFANAALRHKIKMNDVLPELKAAEAYSDYPMSQGETMDQLIR